MSPLSPRAIQRTLIVSAAVVFLGVPSPAAAQDAPLPKFEFDKTAPKPVDWKVQAKGGALITSGNSQSRNGTLSLTGSRQAGSDKLSLEGGVAYGESNILVPIVEPDPVDMTKSFVTRYDRQEETTTNEWKARGRYDRFLTANNAAYVLGQIGGDRIAGKAIYGGGQVGYSRQVYKSERHTLAAELGYDFSYESYVAQPGKTVDPVAIHSARLFAGELFSVTDDTGISASLEALFNLNREKALDADDPTGNTKEVKSFKDTRLIGKLGLTTTLWKNVSFGFGFTLKYDQNPAPRPIPKSAKGAGYPPNVMIFSEGLDTLTEATLVVTFL